MIWSKRAHEAKDTLYFEGRLEFGVTIANKTARKIEEIEKDLSRWPTSGFPEPLLRGYVPFYRSRHINKRFKLLYWYDEEVDMVAVTFTTLADCPVPTEVAVVENSVNAYNATISWTGYPANENGYVVSYRTAETTVIPFKEDFERSAEVRN